MLIKPKVSQKPRKHKTVLSKSDTVSQREIFVMFLNNNKVMFLEVGALDISSIFK